MTLTNFDDNAHKIAKRQYMHDGDHDLSGMFWRIARHVATAEAEPAREHWAQAYYDLMADKKFSPGGRIIAGAGTAHGQLLNCFVQRAHEHDPSTLDGVMELAMKLALVTKVGGGNGVNIDDFATQTFFGHHGVRGLALLTAAHADVNDFVQGLMRPPTQPDGDKQPITLRTFDRAVYGSAEQLAPLRALAERHGVTLIEGAAPSGTVVVPDDMRGIMTAADTVVRAGLRAGTAADATRPVIDLSHMRPEGTPIKGSGGTSSGPVSFLFEIFDNFLEWANRGAHESGPINTLRFVGASVLRVVRQGGTRRGAGMATIDIGSPHVLDFLTAKDLDREQGEGDISTFNISILVTEAFWETLQRDGAWSIPGLLGIPDKYTVMKMYAPYRGAFETVEVGGVTIVPLFEDGIPARWLWNQIARHAWSTGEPGLIFSDRVNEYSAISGLGAKYQIRSTNPCGEIPLTPGEPCDLGAINLAAYVRSVPIKGQKGKTRQFDFQAFREDIVTCVRFLDDVLDINVFPLEDNRQASQRLRRLGLGVMGLADALILMGLRYDDDAGRAAITEIMGVLRDASVEASEALGRERGVYAVYAEHEETMKDVHRPRRNVAVLTVAPTGTTSMLMGVSSGIEPIFSPFIWRKIGAEYRALLAPLFVELLEKHPAPADMSVQGAWDWDRIIQAVSDNHGSVVGLDFIPKSIQDVFICAHDISPVDHVRMQGAVQVAFDDGGQKAANSLSKTINLPNDATVQDVEDAYTEAYRTGCKGITVYRDGSRQFQVLSTSMTGTDVAPEASALDPELAATIAELTAHGQMVLVSPGEHGLVAETFDPATLTPQPAPAEGGSIGATFKRTGRLTGFTDAIKLMDPVAQIQRSFLVTVNSAPDSGQPIEVMVISGRAGDESNADSEALGRVVSIALQYNVPAGALIKTLRGINGGLYGSYQGRMVSSKADLIAVGLESALDVLQKRGAHPEQHHEPAHEDAPAAAPSGVRARGTGMKCTVCKEDAVIREEGCLKCQACGYSKCG